jgi:hypothetical protein
METSIQKRLKQRLVSTYKSQYTQKMVPRRAMIAPRKTKRRVHVMMLVTVRE